MLQVTFCTIVYAIAGKPLTLTADLNGKKDRPQIIIDKNIIQR